ncbi:MAG: hypothetical protein FJ102_18085 [Deltaproteobacteria bacterium]|nr:hypothetical protein [Deltaproteobacteria bacterium]
MIPLLVFLAACDGGDPPESGCTGACGCEASVDVGGTSYDDDGRPIWVEMPAGSEQTMVHGPQGGWHVLAAARVQGTAEVVSIEYTIEYPAREAQLSYGLFRVMLVAEGECGGYYPSMFGILDVAALAAGDADTPPELLGGEELLLRMDVDDGEGAKASDEVTVVAALDPQDVEDTGDTGAPDSGE